MITVTNDLFSIDPKYSWEESDLKIAATLSHETERRFLEMAREIRETLMSTPLHGTAEEMLKINMETSFLRGKYELLVQLVQASKEEKVAAHLI